MSVRLSVNVWEAVFALFYRQVLLVSPLVCVCVCVCDFGLEFAYESFCELACESVSLSFIGLLVCHCSAVASSESV